MLWIEKYRPRRFEEMAGQAEVKTHLSSFSSEGSVPHMLFFGPHGTGKSVAMECLARRLYGDSWTENTSIIDTALLFGQGKSYLENEEKFSHLYQKSESLIVNFKHIVKWYASMRPLNAPFKIIVFENAGALTFEAQQALRRIMERYSTTCRFIFISTNQSTIIPAISSRCLPFFFAPLSSELILERLGRIMVQEGITDASVPHEEREIFIQAAQGDLRRAITYLQLFHEQAGKTDLAEMSLSETGSVAGSLFIALESRDLRRAMHLGETLMIEYGLSGREVVEELRAVARREYNHPGIALALADTDACLGHAGNEYIQVNALFARIITEVFA